MVWVGGMAYAKAGKALTEVLRSDARYQLGWVARRANRCTPERTPVAGTDIPDIAVRSVELGRWLDKHRGAARVDFSRPQAVHRAGRGSGHAPADGGLRLDGTCQTSKSVHALYHVPHDTH